MKKVALLIFGCQPFLIKFLLLYQAASAAAGGPRACLKIKNCTKHLFLSPFYSIIKKKGCSLC